MTELTVQERALLGRCPLLLDADEALVLRVAGAEDAWVQDFAAGEVLYQPHRFLRCLGVLLSGQVRVTNGALSVDVYKRQGSCWTTTTDTRSLHPPEICYTK